jgi:peptidyl-prolyl cis-trans isomerase C
MTIGPSMISPRIARLGALFAVAFLAIAAPAAAQNPSTTVLNGVPITDADLALAAAEFADQIGQVPEANRRAALIDLIINIRLSSAAAEASGLDKQDVVAKRLELARQKTLYSEFLRQKFTEKVTEEAARKIFEGELANFVPGDQVRASHVLVKTEDEAKAIIVELDAGGDFAAIAKSKSTDPGSGANGGDLGFFSKGQMVKPFEDAAFTLEVGTYTKAPVQSDFGWHVIKVTEKRKAPPPTFETESQRLRQQLVRDTFETEINALRAAAKIEITPGVPTPEQPPPAGEAPATPAPAP